MVKKIENFYACDEKKKKTFNFLRVHVLTFHVRTLNVTFARKKLHVRT